MLNVCLYLFVNDGLTKFSMTPRCLEHYTFVMTNDEILMTNDEGRISKMASRPRSRPRPRFPAFDYENEDDDEEDYL
jgi:hypothetical protein